MSTRKIITKDLAISGNAYVGHTADIWVDGLTNTLRLGDSITPGGIQLPSANLTTLLSTYTGNISGNVNGVSIGYLDIPQNPQSSNYILSLSDQGKHIYSTNSSIQTVTIPNSSNVAMPIGTAVSLVLNGTGNILVSSQSNVTLYLAGNSTVSSTRTVGAYGLGTLLKVYTDTWFITGVGVS